MKKFIFGLLLLISFQSYSQVLPEDETLREAKMRNQKLVDGGENGYYATNLQDLVDSSVVVVRGTWGALERRGIDYGGVTKEQVIARTGVSEELAETYGLPFAHYEIEIDEIIKGAETLVGASVLTVGLTESEDALDVFKWVPEFREGEHLFFLFLVPGGEFHIRGDMFDMKLVGNSYMYYADDDYVPAFGSDRAAEFLATVRALSAK